MVGLDNPRYFRHITEHLNNPHINFIRTENCEYCKLARRRSYGNTFRNPVNLNIDDTTPIDFSNLQEDNVVIDLTRNRNYPVLITNETNNRRIGNVNITHNPNIYPSEHIEQTYQTQQPQQIQIQTQQIQTYQTQQIQIQQPQYMHQTHQTQQTEQQQRSYLNIYEDRRQPINDMTNVIQPTNMNNRNLNQYPIVEYNRNGYDLLLENRNNLYAMQENIFNMRENHLNQIDNTLDINRSLLRNLNEFTRIIEDMEEINYENIRIEEQDLDDIEPKTTLEEINNFSKLETYKYNNPEKCSICHDYIKKNDIIRTLGCSHFFHYQCVDTWLENKQQCPLCRTSILTI